MDSARQVSPWQGNSVPIIAVRLGAESILDTCLSVQYTPAKPFPGTVGAARTILQRGLLLRFGREPGIGLFHVGDEFIS
jgi:hypothetical protein